MSARKAYSGEVRDVLGVDFRTKIEAVLGVDVDSTNGLWGPEMKPIASTGKKVKWDPSPNYNQGVTWMTTQSKILGDGRIIIGDDSAISMFDKTHHSSPKASNGVLLLKVVSEMQAGDNYFVVPARFRNRNVPNDIAVYSLDRLDKRDNGSVVYTIPVHNLAQGARKFFFVVLLKPIFDEPDKINLIIQKIEVTRGKNYFRVSRNDYYHSHFKKNCFVAQAEQDKLIADLDWPTIYRLFQETMNGDKIATVSRY